MNGKQERQELSVFVLWWGCFLFVFSDSWFAKLSNLQKHNEINNCSFPEVGEEVPVATGRKIDLVIRAKFMNPFRKNLTPLKKNTSEMNKSLQGIQK